jgi:hypothetical protein
MLSGTLPQVNGHDLGKHPTVLKLMKGIFNSNPPKPKYSGTWDVDLVIKFFKSAPPNKELSLIQLSRKTAMLLALVTRFRVSELAAIDSASLVFSDSGLQFSLSKLRKSQRARPLLSRTITRLEDSKICPVSTTEDYWKATLALRKPGESGNLLLGSVKPHSQVKGSTISHWIKKTLDLAGVDTSIYSAHSTRGASASKAAKKGVPTDSILKTASCASESTFVRYYRRDPRAGCGDNNPIRKLMWVTYIHLDRLKCFEITARKRTNLCNTINTLFKAARSAADGQLGLYEINKGSLIAVSYPPILIPNDNRFFLFYFIYHQPRGRGRGRNYKQDNREQNKH